MFPMPAFEAGERVDGTAGNAGKTTTALGRQEWLKSAVSGEIETPMLVRSVELVSEKEFEVNCSGTDVMWERSSGSGVSPCAR